MILMKSMHKNICYGLHCSKITPIFTAIGGGAKKIFVYVGDKKLNLPDKPHSIDIKYFNLNRLKLIICTSTKKKEILIFCRVRWFIR